MKKKPTIAIIDYGMGNLRSVAKAVEWVGGDAVVTDNARQILDAQGVIFPGVGSFGPAVRYLKKRKLIDTIREVISKDRCFLGLCLGFQLLFSTSTEDGNYEGLGIVPGKVEKFSFRDHALKVPHMGWNQVTCTDAALKKTMFNGIKDNAYFYFVHSYYGIPRRKNMIAATTDYGKPFCSAVAHGRVWGCQFHPEKSSASGLRLLKNFLTEVTAC
ncbi:MAG: imidazole glycerol phosphate synthase subunit HisH [Elusimicrobia bacterium]|nr:imidazole glycerol phosphate synthase subunit HisH [Elusimicrobiota bacterium]